MKRTIQLPDRFPESFSRYSFLTSFRHVNNLYTTIYVRNNSSLNGNEKTVDKVLNRGKEIIIKTLEDETDEVPTYIANWENEDIAYYIAGKIELKELKKY